MRQAFWQPTAPQDAATGAQLGDGHPPGRQPSSAHHEGRLAQVVEEVRVDITLQYVSGRSHWQMAGGRLLEALEVAGFGETEVDHRLISSPEEAEAVGFRGSPAVRLDGVDPFADHDAPVGQSWRVHRSDAGPAGSPAVEQLLAVLR